MTKRRRSATRGGGRFVETPPIITLITWGAIARISPPNVCLQGWVWRILPPISAGFTFRFGNGRRRGRGWSFSIISSSVTRRESGTVEDPSPKKSPFRGYKREISYNLGGIRGIFIIPRSSSVLRAACRWWRRIPTTPSIARLLPTATKKSVACVF